jgi:hypothetical protein
MPDANATLGIWEPISYVTPSAAAVVFTNLSAFERLRIHGFLYPSVLGELGMQFSTDNGSTWISGASSYRSQIQASTGATVSAALATTTFVKVTGGTAANNTVINGAEFMIVIGSFNKAERSRSLITNYTESNATLFQTMTVASEDGVAARNALRFLSGASTMTGRIILEGMRG